MLNNVSNNNIVMNESNPPTLEGNMFKIYQLQNQNLCYIVKSKDYQAENITISTTCLIFTMKILHQNLSTSITAGNQIVWILEKITLQNIIKYIIVYEKCN